MLIKSYIDVFVKKRSVFDSLIETKADILYCEYGKDIFSVSVEHRLVAVRVNEKEVSPMAK